MRDKLGAGGKTLKAALRTHGRHLPKRVRAHIRALADAERFADHPKLRLTLDAAALGKAAATAQDHLRKIDKADRRKGWWLGVLGGLVFNLLLLFAICICVLVWLGYV